MTETKLVQVTDLKIERAGFGLHVPQWSIEPGSVVGVVGPNGAGKTTLLDCLAGIVRPTSGQVRVLGHDPSLDPVFVRSRTGFMSDDRPLFDLRVDKLLRVLSGYYTTWDDDLVAHLVQRFGLDLRAHVRELSKGQGTCLRVIAALAFRPTVVVLDEPGTGLDLGARQALLRSVIEVARDPVRSVVVSSHQLTDLERIADALLVLRAGKVVAQGPTDSVIPEGKSLSEALVHMRASGSEVSA
ncbi:MAG: ABC transporter ATP-binding protein [Nannocystales bacterium]